MRSMILAIIITLCILPANAVEKNITAKVCVDAKDRAGRPLLDPGTKKTKQNCRTVKKHKKLESFKKVPDSKNK